MPFHVCGKLVCARELFVACFAQSFLHNHLFALFLLTTGLPMPACNLFAGKLFPTHHTRVGEPSLNAGVGFLVESQAVSSVCGKAAIGETALKKFHVTMASFVSSQVTGVSEPPLTLGTNIGLF